MQYESDVIQRLFLFTAAATFGATIKEIFDKMFFPYFNIYRQIFKNETMVEIWKVQMVMDQIRNKAFEISVLERQKEKNDFLISFRTASGLIVFYWDEVLKHKSESPSFHAKYLDSRSNGQLIELRNASEKYHVLLDPDTRHALLKQLQLFHNYH
ncbi:unnamed protein product [Leuciscus chuanchicus]